MAQLLQSACALLLALLAASVHVSAIGHTKVVTLSPAESFRSLSRSTWDVELHGALEDELFEVALSGLTSPLVDEDDDDQVDLVNLLETESATSETRDGDGAGVDKNGNEHHGKPDVQQNGGASMIDDSDSDTEEDDSTDRAPETCDHYNVCMGLKPYIGVGKAGTNPSITPEEYCSKDFGSCKEQCIESAKKTLASLNNSCREKRGPVNRDDWWTLCASESKIRDLLGSTGDILGWSEPAKVGWANDEITYAWEKESRDLSILNLYHPEVMSKKEWKELCPAGRDLCVSYTCSTKKKVTVNGKSRAPKPCVPQGTKEELEKTEDKNPMYRMYMCLQRKTPNEASQCIDKMKTDNLIKADYADALQGKLATYYTKKIVEFCVWTKGAGDTKSCSHANIGRDVPGEVCDCVSRRLGEAASAFLDSGKISPRNGAEGEDRIFNDDVVNMLKEQSKERKADPDKRSSEEFFDVITFADYVKHEKKWLSFLNPRLQQEVATFTWEVSHRFCEATLGAAFGQVAIIQGLFGNTKNLHFHVVFKRPKAGCCDCDLTDWEHDSVDACNPAYSCDEGSCPNAFVYKDAYYTASKIWHWGWRTVGWPSLDKSPEKIAKYKHKRGLASINRHMAAFATHLNDYGALNSYESNWRTKYLAVWNTEAHEILERALVKGENTDGGLDELEAMSDGHNWGTYKQAFIALRTNVYGRGRIGFEIRGGLNKALTEEQATQLRKSNITSVVVAYEPVLFVERMLGVLTKLEADAEKVANVPVRISVQNDLYFDSKDRPKTIRNQENDRRNYTLGELYDFVRNERTVGWKYFGTDNKDDNDTCFGGCSKVGGTFMPDGLLRFTLNMGAEGSLRAFKCSASWATTEEYYQGYARRMRDADAPLGTVFNPTWRLSESYCTCHENERGNDESPQECQEKCRRDMEQAGPRFAACAKDVWKRWSFVMLNLKSWETFLTRPEVQVTSGDASATTTQAGDASGGDDETLVTKRKKRERFVHQDRTKKQSLEVFDKPEFTSCFDTEVKGKAKGQLKNCEFHLVKQIFEMRTGSNLREKFHH